MWLPPRFVAYAVAWCMLGLDNAQAAIQSTWPVEHAAERAELIVLGKRGAKGQDQRFLGFVVTKVVAGSAAKEGDVLLIQYLGGYSSVVGEDKLLRQAKGPDLHDAPNLLFLSRKALTREEPANAFELQTAGYGTAVKIIDGHNVYGYYQWMNPGPYVLTREGGSREELLRRVDRGRKLGAEWARITRLPRELRESAILEFLADRTLPSYFCCQASIALSNSRLLSVIRDEVENVTDPPRSPRSIWEPDYPDQRGWTRLGAALLWVKVEDDGKELLPLLQRIKSVRPSHHEAAVRCAGRTCGTPAIEYLKQAMVDIVAFDDASRGLARIGTPEAAVALEAAIVEQIDRHGSASWSATSDFAKKWPGRWQRLSANLATSHSDDAKVREYLQHSWQALVRTNVIQANDVPAPFRTDLK